MDTRKEYISEVPRLINEWNWEKNINIDPAQVTTRSGRKVWWICSKGHEWQAKVAHRKAGSGCSYCSHKKAIKGENDLQTVNPTLAGEWNYEKNNGLMPRDVLPSSNKKVWWKCSKGHEWQAVINSRNSGCGCPICAGRQVLVGYNDLQTVNLTLAKEWNYERNGDLTPEQFVVNSNKKVWWKCSKGHEWQAQISHRSRGSGCPYCAGKKVLQGYNDLQTVNPALVEEWNWERNTDINPNQITIGSDKKVWWKCSKGHEWQAVICDRHSGTGCPYCASKKVLVGYNDLYTVNPIVAKEWNYEKNGTLTPEHITANSNKKVWWKCKKGHEWQAAISSRNMGRSCPICSAEYYTSFPEYAIIYYLKKYGLEVLHLYKEKGYELDIFIPSNNIAIEYDGYRWHKNIAQRDLNKNAKCAMDGIILYRIREGLPTLNDSSLDYIVNKDQKDLSRVLATVLSEIVMENVDVDLERDAIYIDDLRELVEKKRSFLFVNPEVASEWNYEKNGSLRPEQFAANSHKKVWWKCSKGHEWQATISHRHNGRECPYCAGKRVIQGENDLQTVNPTLAGEWNYARNKGLTPTDVKPHSNKKVWWICSKGHEWQSIISDRSRGNGCPYCAKEKRKTIK